MNRDVFSPPKMPIKLRILNVLIYVGCHIYFWVLMFFNQLMPVNHLFGMLGSWQYLTHLFVTILIAILINSAVAKKLLMYDGTEKTYDYVSKTAKLFPIISIALPIICMSLLPLTLQAACISKNINFIAFPVWVTALGSLFLIALISYIVWMQRFEPWVKWLPLEKKYKSMDQVARSVMVAFFSASGISLCIMGAFYLIKEAMPFSQVISYHVFPTMIIGLFFGMIDFYLQAKGSANRLKEVVNVTQHLSEKDYTVEDLSIVSRDEFGMLMKQLNIFVNSTKDLLKKISRTEEVSEDVAEKLQKEILETESVVTQIIGNISAIKNDVINQSAGVEEAHSTVSNIQQRIEKLNTQIESQSTSVSESSAAVEQMVANIRSVTDILGKNALSVNNLGKASEVGQNKVEEAVVASTRVIQESAGLIEATEVIQNIATQTNLLAMNAAIEAAHAGEAGKGFAVVADEIRKLAEDSNTQGQTISARLKDLEDSITAIATNTKEVQTQFDTIFELTNNVKTQEGIIKSAMDEQSAGSGQVLSAMQSINDITVSVRDSSVEMLTGSKEIVAEMDVLAQVTNNVNEAMLQITQGADRIKISLKKTSDVSKENESSIEKLGIEVKTFKL